MKCLSLAVPEVVKMTTSSVASDKHLIKITTFMFQWFTIHSVILKYLALAPFKPFVNVYHSFPWIHNSFRGVALITLHKCTHNSCFMIVAEMSELVCYLATRWHGFLSCGSHQPCYWSSDCLSHHSLPQKLPLVNSLCPQMLLCWIAKNYSDSVENYFPKEEMTALIDILIFNFSVYFSEIIMNLYIHFEYLRYFAFAKSSTSIGDIWRKGKPLPSTRINSFTSRICDSNFISLIFKLIYRMIAAAWYCCQMNATDRH